MNKMDIQKKICTVHSHRHGILPPPNADMKQLSGDTVYARTKYGSLQSLSNRFQGNASLLMTAPSSVSANLNDIQL